MDVREMHRSVASRPPLTGDLARNPGMRPDWGSNCDLSVRRPALNPLGHTGQGCSRNLFFGNR